MFYPKAIINEFTAASLSYKFVMKAHNMILQSVIGILNRLNSMLLQLSDEQYSSGCSQLGGASIGAHTRHIIELFQCLDSQYDSGNINYDSRARNKQLEQRVKKASDAIQALKENLNKENKSLYLKQQLAEAEVIVASNYERELLYNLEHCIHHEALIKVALREHNDIVVSEDFGVAASTIAYKKQCAQ
jgi:hypothetical protein